MAKIKIGMVYRLPNDSVMVFDTSGEQMPQYQGKYHEMRQRVLQDAPPAASFARWPAGSKGPNFVAREDW